MSESSWTLDAKELDRLTEAAEKWPEVSEDAINEVLHGEAKLVLAREIDKLIPVSGRTFKGHTHGAKGSGWASYDLHNLGVTVAARGKYGYLYFPDDGSNTARHAGNKQFFPRGGDNATAEVVDMCIEEIIRRIEE